MISARLLLATVPPSVTSRHSPKLNARALGMAEALIGTSEFGCLKRWTLTNDIERLPWTRDSTNYGLCVVTSTGLDDCLGVSPLAQYWYVYEKEDWIRQVLTHFEI